MPYRRLGAHCSLLPLVLLVARGWTSEPSCVELVASSLEAMSLKDETDISPMPMPPLNPPCESPRGTYARVAYRP